MAGGVGRTRVRPTQRIGIVPDLFVRPTVEGIRAGRDEVLEAGVSQELGREFRLPAVSGRAGAGGSRSGTIPAADPAPGSDP